MCMTLCYARYGLAVAASDSRHTLRGRGASPEHADFGGKLMRFGDVSLAMLGDAAYCQVAAERLIEDGAGSVEDVCDSLARTSRTADAEIARRWPEITGIKPDKRSPFLAACDGEVCGITTAGTILERGRADLYVLDPADDYNTDAAALAVMLGGARSQWDVLRTVARAFAVAAECSPLVSPVVEMTVGRLYLAGNAATLSHAFDCSLDRALHEPPANDPGVFTRILNTEKATWVF